VIRAFIAVELDDALRKEIAGFQQTLRTTLDRAADGARIAWVRPASLHLTLKFMGDVDESIVQPLHQSIVSAASAWRPIEVAMVRLGGFPRLQEPRNLWLGPDERWEESDDARRLQVIARAIDERVAAHGIDRERRPFSPHLTLGRVKAGERAIGRVLASELAVTKIDLRPLAVSTVTLMKSQLDSKGAIHTPLWTVQLDR
jgi:2'-5' RNA ligase